MQQADQRVEVLLATWNGASFLAQQLASLMDQSYQQFEILVRDDGSSDETLKILEEWRQRNPGRIRIIPSHGANLGALGNFATLLSASTAEYVLFCDQDDRWHPDKVAVSLTAMRELEKDHRDIPLLVHGDLRVVDATLREIAPSFARYQHFNLEWGGVLRRVLVQNTVTGCTMLMNRRLVDLCLPIPAAAVMHDHWIALVAAAFGRVHALHRPLLDYRQHGRNAIGAAGQGFLTLIGQVRGSRTEMRRRLQRSWGQAQAFADHFAERLDPVALTTVRAWADMPTRGFIGRRTAVIRHGLWKCGLHRNLMTLVAM